MRTASRRDIRRDALSRNGNPGFLLSIEDEKGIQLGVLPWLYMAELNGV